MSLYFACYFILYVAFFLHGGRFILILLYSASEGFMGNGPLHYDQQLDSSFTKHANVSRMVPTYQRSPSNVVLYLQNKILYLIAVVFQIIDV